LKKLKKMLKTTTKLSQILIMAKPKLPLNPYSKYTKENYQKVAATFGSKNPDPKLVFAEIKENYNNLGNEVILKEKKQHKLNLKKYKLDLKEFHRICGEISGLEKPVAPELPKDTGYSLYNKDTLEETLAALPLDYEPIELFKEQAKNWKNLPKSTQDEYNKKAAPAMEIYKQKHAEYKIKLQKFEAYGEPIRPKNAITAYSLYSKDMMSSTKTNFPSYSNSEITKEISKSWNNEAESIKNYYFNQVKDDKIRFEQEFLQYKKDMLEFNSKMIKVGKMAPIKPTDSYYQLFFEEKKAEIERRNPDVYSGEVPKMVADEWNRMSKEEKSYFKDLQAEKEVLYEEQKKRFENRQNENREFDDSDYIKM